MLPTVSIIVPLYYAEKLFPPLIIGLETLAQQNKEQFKTEIIFVDDGSKDNTFKLVQNLKPEHFSFQAIRLARNFKSYIAILAGIQQARGDYITFLAQDLQEPPELISQFFGLIQDNYDVVWAVRRTRADGFLDRLFSQLFHRLMNKIWSDWPKTGADMFMINRPVANVLLSMQEKNSHISGQILWSGFRQTQIFYDRQKRKIGKSGWSFWKKVELAVSVITQFSYLPIRACTVLGLILATTGFFYGILVIVQRLTLQITLQGWSALMIVLLIIGGFQFIFLGVIGEYLWRVFDEVRKRPAYIVMERIEGGNRE
ncbi:glycosyltransferase family 2 protein [Spirulina subsalsa FACHB-351]|uniref:Glycosyltransferase family 2 protein n=1 Tax=Spirulina subsalsa FACHB-351 TaxID=234711 RepID=A0ABT3LBM4_9CYAN|nr:glycosyltransferase family 2 protein [Spirulina subsalsa]MCW6038891.1 glycosyltransferase family 2 protein [Spirulina subsalsa FACHB-351]